MWQVSVNLFLLWSFTVHSFINLVQWLNVPRFAGLRGMALWCAHTCVGYLFLENSTVLIVSKAVCESEQEIEFLLRVGPISWVEELVHKSMSL